MRRILSIALLFVFALPLVAPALGQTAQQRLLLCCRKGGAHHCITSATEGTPTLHEHCAASPSAAIAGHATNWIIGDASATSVAAEINPLRIRQVEAGYRISFHRSRQKRGPPASFLS
jgi:hypothetical protein